MRASLDEDPAFQHVVGLWDQAKGALLGIGAPPATRDALARGIPVEDDAFDSAAGDVCLNFFDADGAAIEFPGSERMVRIPPETLAAIPHAVGIAVGAAKVPSILGAVTRRSGQRAGVGRRHGARPARRARLNRERLWARPADRTGGPGGPAPRLLSDYSRPWWLRRTSHRWWTGSCA